MTKTWKESNTFLKLREAENTDIFEQALSAAKKALSSSEKISFLKNAVESSLDNVVNHIEPDQDLQDIGNEYSEFEANVDGYIFIGGSNPISEASAAAEDIKASNKFSIYLSISQAFPTMSTSSLDKYVDLNKELNVAITSKLTRSLRNNLMTDMEVGSPWVRKYREALLNAIELGKTSKSFTVGMAADMWSKKLDIVYMDFSVDLPLEGDIPEDAKKALEILSVIMKSSSVANEYLDHSRRYSRLDDSDY